MVGIYLITNKVNGKVYVGQSVDIHRRWIEHLRSGQPDKYPNKHERDANTPLHKAMAKYGVENFQIEILEECSKEQLDERERFWIQNKHSFIDEEGYNLSLGGQDHVGAKGEHHSQAKLTQIEVDEIKRLLKETDLSLNQICSKFDNKVGKSMICLINTGKNWFDENEDYPLRKKFKIGQGENAHHAILNDEIVMEIRTKYSQGIPKKQLEKEYCLKYNVSASTIQAVLYGRTFKHLPIWKNTEKRWIEPCNDYSQSLK